MIRGDQTSNRQCECSTKNQITREIGKQCGQANAEMIDESLRARNHNEKDHLIDEIGYIETKCAGKEIPCPDIDRTKNCHKTKRLSQAVSQPVKRLPRMEPQ